MVSKYFSNLEKAENEIEKIIASINPTDEYDPNIDYAEVLKGIYDIKFNIRRMLNIHKYLRLSKDDFIRQTDSNTLKKNLKNHVVKDFETPLSIANKYGITLDELLDINNKGIAEFNAGDQILIPVANEIIIARYEEIPTLGTHNGSAVLGSDLPNQLIEDNIGDLLVLDNIETVKQGMNNLIKTEEGKYPLDNSFGIKTYIGEDIPGDLAGGMGMLDFAAKLAEDKRIKQVGDIIVEDNGDSDLYYINATTITGESIKN